MEKPRHISDVAILLNRINYGEKDRIITFITPNNGKLTAIVKGVRSNKSKLAGGIELFAINHLVLIKGKNDLHVVTSSRMEKYFSNITKDVDRSQVAYTCLRSINKLAPDYAGNEFYDFLNQAMVSLDNPEVSLNQIKTWVWLRLLLAIGAEPNLKTLQNGDPIPASKNYYFDFDHQCFAAAEDGPYNQNHIKVLRYFLGGQKMNMIKDCPEEISKQTEHLLNLILQEHIS